MRFYVNSESWEGGRGSQVGRQRVPDSRSNVTKRTFTEGLQVCVFLVCFFSSLSVEERRERDTYVQREEDRYGGRVPSK